MHQAQPAAGCGSPRLGRVLPPSGSDLRRGYAGPHRKHLPDPDSHERAWAFVAHVSDRAEDLRAELRQRTYETKTRGERRQPPARPVGEGRYMIADHDGHSHLAYVLELPPGLGDAQRTMRIAREASYVVAVRNPDAPAPPGMGRTRRTPNLPEHLRNRFGGRRFAQLDAPEWLDDEGVELVSSAPPETQGGNLAWSWIRRASRHTMPTCPRSADPSRRSAVAAVAQREAALIPRLRRRCSTSRHRLPWPRRRPG